jgi:hypothetical protein
MDNRIDLGHSMQVYEVRPRKDKRGVDVISASEMPNDSAHFFP